MKGEIHVNIKRIVTIGAVVGLVFAFAATAMAKPPKCQAARTKVDELKCGPIALVVNKVCVTTNSGKTQMVGVEIVAVHPGVSGAAATIYESGPLGTSMTRLIKANKGKDEFVLHEQRYKKDGFKKVWAVIDHKAKKITKLKLKIKLPDEGEICKKVVEISKYWGTKWWNDKDEDADKF